MNARRITMCLGLLAVAFLVVRPVLSDDKDAAAKSKHPDAGSEMDKMMKEMAKYSEPGPYHKRLEPFMGAWTVETRCWMDPSAPPEISKGNSTNKWILDGRVSMSEFEGMYMQKPFRGFGLSGYDNYKKKYWCTWCDTMCTGIMVQWGDCDASGKVFTYTGEYDDPMTKTTKKAKSVSRIINESKFVFEMFDVAPDGKETRTMEITYSRR